MRKNLLLLFLAAFVIQTAWADDISVEQAISIAQQFVSHDAKAKALGKTNGNSVEPRLAHAVKSKTSQKDNVYVINLGDDQGFVIVAGDDGADAEVLGYCDHGTFEYDKAPVQFKDLLANYSAGVDSLRLNNVASAKSISIASAKTMLSLPEYMGSIVVGPLLTTTWSQSAPYNNLCPEGCPSGCVPTAVAQVMNYWKWPKQSGGTILRHNAEGFYREDFPVHTYDWDNMIDDYSGSYTYEQGMAVAQLMADLGHAFHTTYTPEGSGTAGIFPEMVENFDYDSNYGIEHGHSGKDLIGAMKQELDSHRPILYSASPKEGEGHELVVDGYTTNYYFHFNYGWGGSYDGWYKNGVCRTFDIYPSIYTFVRPRESKRVSQDNINYALLPDSTAEILSYNIESGNDIDLVIPNTVKDEEGNVYKVVRINDDAFTTYCRFREVTIGDNIKEIGRYAFVNSHIETLIIGDKMEVIPDEAFQTTGVKNLVIGASVKHIGRKAFYACNLSNITCKSPALSVGENAFTGCRIDCGEWFDHITELGDRSFSGVSFRTMPHFRNVVKMGSEVFSGSSGFNEVFIIYPSVKKIATDAFENVGDGRVKVHEDNPYFSNDGYHTVFNKQKTSLVLATRFNSLNNFPETMIRMEKGCINPRPKYNDDVTIPNTVEDVTGAFTKCGADIGTITCLAVVPPHATYNTFNDEMFEADPERKLHVPIGCENIYRNAPGWSRFNNIIADQPYVLPTSQPDRQYFMILHCSDENKQTLRIPVGSVKNIRVGDYISSTGASVIVSQDGAKDNAYRVDSIKWMRGFVYDDAEVFDLSPDNLVAEGQDCTVKLGATVIDNDVQLAIRKAINTVPFIEGTTRSMTFDISLSNDVHELSGVAEIIVPFEREEDEILCAGYFDEESGEWKPVYLRYDEQQGAAIIKTDHFSLFSILSVEKENSARQLMNYFVYYGGYSTLDKAIKNVLDWLASDNPDKTAIDKWKEEYGFWQGLGIDGGYNTLQGLGFSYETIDNAVGMVGWIGTAMTFLDIVSSDLKGDDTGVTCNSLKTIMSVAQTYVGTVVGSSALSLGMGLVGFIGVALDRFGTKIQEAKTDYVRQIYNLYYTKRGEEIAGHKTFNTTIDWYDIFYPAVKKQHMNEERLNALIEQTVRRYTDKFWEESSDVHAMFEGEKVQDSKPFLFTTFHNVSESDKAKISQEHFEALMNGTLVSVFQEIKNKLEVEAERDLKNKMVPFFNMMNSYIGLQIKDSSCPEGAKSDYSGWTIRFTHIPDSISDPQNWGKVISDNGTCKLGYYTLNSLLINKIPLQLTLVDPFGEEHSTYDFDLSKFDEDSYNVIEIDLASEGQEIDVIDRLEVKYDENELLTRLDWDMHWDYDEPYSKNGHGQYYSDDGSFDINCLILMNPNGYYVYQPKARFQTEIEKFFREHESISIDQDGNYSIGNDIHGSFAGNGRTASGKFTIDTTYDFNEKSKDEFVYNWNNLVNFIDRINNLLDGTIKHHIDCQYTITRNADGSVVSINYTGDGTFDIRGNGVTRVKRSAKVKNLMYSSELYQYDDYRELKPEELVIGPLEFVIEGRGYNQVYGDHYTGPVKLQYTKKIKVNK